MSKKSMILKLLFNWAIVSTRITFIEMGVRISYRILIILHVICLVQVKDVTLLTLQKQITTWKKRMFSNLCSVCSHNLFSYRIHRNRFIVCTEKKILFLSISYVIIANLFFFTNHLCEFNWNFISNFTLSYLVDCYYFIDCFCYHLLNLFSVYFIWFYWSIMYMKFHCGYKNHDSWNISHYTYKIILIDEFN